MVFQPTRLHAFAAAVALVTGGGGGPSSMFASGLINLSVYECADLAPFSKSTLTADDPLDDVLVFLEDGVDITCDEVTTVYVNRGKTFRVNSDNFSVKFTGLRFEISSGSDFTLSLAAGEDVSTATFTGVAGQETNGGVFSVDSDSRATFLNAVVFEDNSVVSPYRGGAVYAGGEVDFQYAVTFAGNEVLFWEDDNSGGGGGLAVGVDGSVMFQDLAYFTGNEVRGGGRGGGMENLGEAYFKRASYFMTNIATENGDEVGGEGGSIYTGEGSMTTFKRRTIHHDNRSSNGGGALWNEGTTKLMSAGFLKGNEASGFDAADGGHIWTSGSVTVDGFVNLRDGRANRDGGAVYLATGGSLDVAGEVTLERNSAGESCDDVFPCTT